MKLKFIVLILTIFSLTLSSCKKEIDSIPIWKSNSSSMSGKIDGVLLECTFANVQTYALSGKTTLQITGNKGSSGFSLMIDDFKGIGTYSLNNDNNIATYLSGTTSMQEAYLSSITRIGSVQITSYTDKLIKGIFEFEGQNLSNTANKNITAGQFSISLVPAKIPETNNGINNLNAKVDGIPTGFNGEAVSTTTPIGSLLTIVGVNGDKRLAISIIGYNGLGTYNLANDGTGVYMKDQSPTGGFYAETGILTISSNNNNRLKGTFSFKAPNQDTFIKTSVNITEGTFDLPYSKR